MKQQTIKKEIKCSGIGLHSGQRVALCLRPAPENSGIVFECQVKQSRRTLRLSPYNVRSTDLATTIGEDDFHVSTVEHLLASLAGLCIDNLFVEVLGSELPIMDGSAASFVFLIRSAGIRKQKALRKVLTFKKPVLFREDNRWIRVQPGRGMGIDYTIDFDHPMVGRQHFAYHNEPDGFIQHLARARTFGFLKDVEKLQSMGLALGGSLDNAVVLDEFGVINPGGMRFHDELVRHKVLDFMGDMALMGAPLWGHFEVYCSGHAFNNSFLRFLDSNRDHLLEEVEMEPARQPSFIPQPEAMPAADPVPA
ncbi:MAG: UDP-3-O-acyl-N-acetylglucosamine deacetylase [Desulfonatronovibrio sp.]